MHAQALQVRDYNIATLLALNPSGNTWMANVQLLQRLRCASGTAHGGKDEESDSVVARNTQRPIAEEL